MPRPLLLFVGIALCCYGVSAGAFVIGHGVALLLVCALLVTLEEVS